MPVIRVAPASESNCTYSGILSISFK